MRLALLILALLVPPAALADPVTVAAIGTYVTSTAFVVQVGLMVALNVYSSYQERRKEQAARDQYNASLKDRTITAVQSDAPFRYVYGRARVGSDIVAIFTSGDRDQYKHLVCVHAAHECDAIEEIYVASKPLGPLDANGFVTSGDYYRTATSHAYEAIFGAPVGSPFTYTLQHAGVDPNSIQVISPALTYDDTDQLLPFSYNAATNQVTFSDVSTGGTPRVSYTYATNTSTVRVQKHLGQPGQTVDAFLQSVVGAAAWPATCTGDGLCYTVVTLDLNQAEFQSGVPAIEVLLRGKKLYDPRTGATTWSRNPALAIYDYLTSEMCGIDAADIPLDGVIAAANVCDTMIAGASTAGTDALYALDGAVLATDDQEQTLTKMAEAMAGGIVGTTFWMWAGSYVAPTISLTIDDGAGNGDVIGELSMTPGLSDLDGFNGVRGQFLSPTNDYVATDFPSYQNPTYVTADGREKWTDLDFPFVNDAQRVRNLCRIMVEDNRNSFTIQAEFSTKAWPLQVGDRAYISSKLFGLSNKVFRVVDMKYAPTSPVTLTLKEDAATIWDLADAVVLDETPNTTLKNPFSIAGLTGLACASGTDQLLVGSDGSITSRILLTWTASTDAAATNGIIDIEYADVSGKWTRTQVAGDASSAYLYPVRDGVVYAIRARLRNPALAVSSDWAYVSHQVVGKTQPPPDVTAFSLTNGTFSWGEVANTPDLDGYLIRFQYGNNTSWDDAVQLHSGVLKHSPWAAALSPPGAVTLMIKAVDTTGNVSVNPAAIRADLGDAIPENIVITYDDAAAGFPGAITNGAVAAGVLQAADSGDLFYGGDTSPAFGSDSLDYFPIATYLALIYDTSYTVLDAYAGSRMLLQSAIAASAYSVLFRFDTQGYFYGSDSDFAFGLDADPAWPAPTDWQTWPGALDSVVAGKTDFRITTKAGPTRGEVSALKALLDVPTISENLNGIAIAAAGTRLPIAKLYRYIQNVQLTLQADGGAAVNATVLDKSTSGPLVQCLNSAGVAVAGTVDATVQGAKG